MRKNKILYASLAVLMILLLPACKTGKSVGKAPKKIETEQIVTDHDLSVREVLVKVEDEQPAFERAQVKRMSVEIDFKGRQLDVKANCKIVSDSAIHISIQPFFGIELFKVEMTPEHIIVVDKTNRTYYESNYGILNQKKGLVVDFYGIQSLLSNRMFVPGKKVVTGDDFQWLGNKSRNTLELANYSIQEHVTLDLSLARITQLFVGMRDDSAGLMARYENFLIFDGNLFPKKILLDLTGDKNPGSFYFDIEEMEFGKHFPMNPINLDRYTKGDINQFFKK